MNHNYRIEKTDDGFKVHFGEATNFPFSISDEREDQAIERANAIACQLRRQEREFLKAIRYTPTRVAMTAPND
jgi:hypothetical protein